jgi:hypothetical protein
MAEIVPLGAAPIDTDRRREFIEALAAAYDNYTDLMGEEPDAMVLLMGGAAQSFRVTHLMQGDTRGRASAFMALAAIALQRSVILP